MFLSYVFDSLKYLSLYGSLCFAKYRSLIDSSVASDHAHDMHDHSLFKILFTILAINKQDEWLTIYWTDDVYNKRRVTVISLINCKYIAGAKLTEKCKDQVANMVKVLWKDLKAEYIELYNTPEEHEYFEEIGKKCILDKAPDLTVLKTKKPVKPLKRDSKNCDFIWY